MFKYFVRLLLVIVSFGAFWGMTASSVFAQSSYEPTTESLSKHEVPDWYSDAKLGIFIHWGVYSVPGWSPLTGEYSKPGFLTSEKKVFT